MYRTPEFMLPWYKRLWLRLKTKWHTYKFNRRYIRKHKDQIIKCKTTKGSTVYFIPTDL